MMSERIRKKDCCFCKEFADGGMSAEYAALAGISHRVIAKYEDFVALPSLSPIKEGHVLILPLTHLTSFAQLTDEGVVNYDQFRGRLASSIASSFGPVFLWEHGLANDEEEGCGVSHAHLHLLPLDVSLAKKVHDSLLKELPHAQLYEFPTLRKLAGKACSYLYWGSPEMGTFGTVADRIPSQLVRRKVCELLGSLDWDWKKLSGWSAFVRTTEDLRAGGTRTFTDDRDNR